MLPLRRIGRFWLGHPLLLLLAAGCVVGAARRPTPGEAASGPPPPPGSARSAGDAFVTSDGATAQPDTPPGPAPSGSVWRSGYWHWDGTGHVWVPGHFEPKPVLP